MAALAMYRRHKSALTGHPRFNVLRAGLWHVFVLPPPSRDVSAELCCNDAGWPEAGRIEPFMLVVGPDVVGP